MLYIHFTIYIINIFIYKSLIFNSHLIPSILLSVAYLIFVLFSTDKAVKFDQSVNYAEETPLMFSRTSSLASLDSAEQHSIHDDRSSVVSDFR